VHCDASVRPLPSRRALVQTSLHFAAALISGTAWMAWRAPCAAARVLKVRKGGAGERDVIELSSGEVMSRAVRHMQHLTAGAASQSVWLRPRKRLRCPTTGVLVADVREGHGTSLHTGDLVVAHIVGCLEDG